MCFSKPLTILSQHFLAKIVSSKTLRTKVNTRLAQPIEINNLDGVRMRFADSSIVHFRQSGNAPEMRIYVETGDRDLTERMLKEVLCGLGVCLAARNVLHE